MTKIRRDLWTQHELPPPRRNPFPDILLPSGIPKAWQKQSSGCQNVPLCATKQAAEVSALTQQKKKKKGGKFKQPIKLLHKFRLDKTPGPYTGTSHRKNSVRGARHGMFFFFFLSSSRNGGMRSESTLMRTPFRGSLRSVKKTTKHTRRSLA